jgi:pimeloyl-ACP methyl ester carboxylesterase
MTTTHVLETDGAAITYDVDAGTAGGPPLLMIGQPMTADGFRALKAQFPERTVVTYDPRGLGRSTRSDGRVDNVPETQAGDVHAVFEAVGGPVELLGSSGGAVTALALVTAYPADVTTLVAHEPPLIPVLPDAEAAARAIAAVHAAYQARGLGAGLAAFIAMTSWRGEFTDAYFEQPAPDPAAFGFPATDDGTRGDPMLSDRSAPVSGYRPDIEALRAAPTRIVVAVGEESAGIFTGRTSEALATLLGTETVVFPGGHGGFAAADARYPGNPEAYAQVLRSVLT